ncbi:hypothetical protein [Cellulomonas sp. KRMCY2]|uniref:hypothetical protein n=1 Tax=Cellulomonas sp. KRMCY2 TaxID=1304865 RepID=UPI00045E9FA9|nr:hypothetical protein [Cellulomonas sp. KRMCY2]
MSNPYAPPPGGSGARSPDPGPGGPAGSPDTPADGARPDVRHPGGGTGPDARHPGGEQRPDVRQPGGPDSAPQRPADPEAVRAASRQVMHFGLLILATLLTASLTLPWQAAALAFAIGAIVVGIRAIRTVWRAGMRGTLVPVLAVGLALAALMSLSLVTMLALWPLQVDRQDCLRGALTISVREGCETAFQDALTARLEQALGQGGG